MLRGIWNIEYWFLEPDLKQIYTTHSKIQNSFLARDYENKIIKRTSLEDILFYEKIGMKF